VEGAQGVIKEQRNEWQMVELEPEKSYVLLFDRNKISKLQAISAGNMLRGRYPNTILVIMCDGFETMDTKTAWGALCSIARMVWRGIWK
jgi:hypothetical protein